MPHILVLCAIILRRRPTSFESIVFKSPKDKKYLLELGGGVLLVELIIVASTLDVYGISPGGVGLAIFYATVAFLLIMSAEAIYAQIARLDRQRARARTKRKAKRGSDADFDWLGRSKSGFYFYSGKNWPTDKPLGGLWMPVLAMLILGLLLFL